MALLTTRPHAVESAPRVTVEGTSASLVPTDRVTCLPRFPSSRRLRRARRTRRASPRRRPNRAVEEIDRAFAIVKEELGTLIQTSTPTTKAIAYVLVVSYLVNLVLPFSATYLALVPEKTIPCVWNVFTSGFYEMNVFGLAVDAVGVMYLGRLPSPSGHARVCQLCRRRPDVRRRRRVRHDVHPVRRHRVAVLPLRSFQDFTATAALTVALRQQLPEERASPRPSALYSRCATNTSPARTASRPPRSPSPAARSTITSAFASPHRRDADAGLPAVLSSSSRRYERGGGGVDVEAVRGDDREEFEFAAQFPAAFAPALRAATDPRPAIFCAGRPAPSRARTPPPRRTCEGSGGRSRRRRRWRRRDRRGGVGEEDARRRELAPAARSF